MLGFKVEPQAGERKYHFTIVIVVLLLVGGRLAAATLNGIGVLLFLPFRYGKPVNSCTKIGICVSIERGSSSDWKMRLKQS